MSQPHHQTHEVVWHGGGPYLDQHRGVGLWGWVMADHENFSQFIHPLITLLLTKALRLVVASHVTSFNQKECISEYLVYY